MKLTGIVGKTIFKDEKTGYSGFFITNVSSPDDNFNKSLTTVFCKGVICQTAKGMPLTLTGIFKKENSKVAFTFSEYAIGFGTNIQLNNVAIIKSFELFDDVEMINDMCKNLVSLRLIRSINELKDQLAEPYKRYAKDIYTRAKHLFSDYELFEFIINSGGRYCDFSAAKRIYGDYALKQIKANPYQTGGRIKMKWATVECIAKGEKIGELNYNRVEGILDYMLEEAFASGDSFVSREELSRRMKRFCGNDAKVAIPAEYLFNIAIMKKDKKYVIKKDGDDEKIYLRQVYEWETEVAREVLRQQQTRKHVEIDMDLLEEIVKDTGITLSESQRKSTECLGEEGLTIITGGPGTGKTSFTDILIKYFKRKYPEDMGIFLCAPTGCAAQNLAGKTGEKAETIHKMLGLTPFGDNECVATTKMPKGIYILDEASMLDLELASYFFKSIPNHSIIILVGDVDQLQSVGAGNVLSDLIDSGVVPCYRLTEVYRQAGNESIVENAHEIINGNTNLNIDGDFSVFTVDDSESAYDFAMMSADLASADVMFLSAIKKSSGGTYKLNAGVQAGINSDNPVKLRYGQVEYRLNDRVIALANNYEKVCFNGDIGTIIDIDEYGLEVRFDKGKVIYFDKHELKDLTLAYAITIHKSQGSEYDEAIIVLTNEAACMMNRNLIYTAVTRAKRKVVIIETKNMLKNAILKEARKRNSGLVRALQRTA